MLSINQIKQILFLIDEVHNKLCSGKCPAHFVMSKLHQIVELLNNK